MLIYVSPEDPWYAYYPKDNRMGVCGMEGKYLPLYFGLILRDETTPCVGFNPIKAKDPQLEIGTDHILFTSMRDERVKVWWEGP